MSLESIIADALAKRLSISQEEALAGLARPPRPDMGDMAFPCFRFAKSLRKAPDQIARDLKQSLEEQA